MAWQVSSPVPGEGSLPIHCPWSPPGGQTLLFTGSRRRSVQGLAEI